MIDLNTKRKLLFDMMRIRMIEEAIADRYEEQEMRCPTHLSIGQEAPAVGVCAHLTDNDYIMSAHRTHAHYLAKGGRLKPMISEFYGRFTGCAKGRGGSMHLIDIEKGVLGTTPIVASSMPLAVGASFGAWLKGEKRLTVVFFGDGATEEGLFSESLNFAALKKLPIIFVCENNFYSVYSNLSVRQPPERSRLAIAKAHGVEGALGNGNDVEEVYLKMDQAVLYAREGLGPFYLEFDTYRWREHCGPFYDNNKGYRTEEEFQSWQKRCPVENYQKKLIAEQTITQERIKSEIERVQQEIQEAFDFAKVSPFPSEDQLLAGVYKEKK